MTFFEKSFPLPRNTYLTDNRIFKDSFVCFILFFCKVTSIYSFPISFFHIFFSDNRYKFKIYELLVLLIRVNHTHITYIIYDKVTSIKID